MRNYEERAKDFIKEIFPYLKDMEDYWEVQSSVYSYNHDYNRKVQVKSGIARIALVTSDYVVKFTYNDYFAEEVGGGEEEIDVYRQAEKDGFGYLFAKVTRFTYHGQNFYIMPRIRNINPNRRHYAYYYMTKEERKWCHDHYINDLHNENYGFRNGHVCVFDYACIK